MAETIKVLSRDKSGVDTKELRKLTKDFMGWNPDKELKKMLRTAGELIAADARILAAGSKSIPPTIKVSISKTRLSVKAGGEGVPLAGLWELGNRGRGKSQAAASRGTFRHPVFGHKDVWVNQPTHPFLLPASEKNKRAIESLEGKAVAEAFRERDLPMTEG